MDTRKNSECSWLGDSLMTFLLPTLMYDIHCKTVPTNLIELFTNIDTIHSYDTQSLEVDNFYEKFPRLQQQNQSFSQTGCKILNKLPQYLWKKKKQNASVVDVTVTVTVCCMSAWQGNRLCVRTSVSFVTWLCSLLPIPHSSFSASGPEDRPRQENNVHHKIKDIEQDAWKIECIDDWVDTVGKRIMIWFKWYGSYILFTIVGLCWCVKQ